MTTPTDHELEITVGSGGKLDVKIHFRGRVPDHLAAFSDKVRRRALRFFWIKTPYERQLWKATKDMPWWGRMTVRQHLLRERAIRIQARLDAADAKKRAKAERVTVSAHQKVAVPQQPRVTENAPVVARQVSASVSQSVPERRHERHQTQPIEKAKPARSERVETPVVVKNEPQAMPAPERRPRDGQVRSDAVPSPRTAEVKAPQEEAREKTREPNLLSPIPRGNWRDAGTAWSGPQPKRSRFLELIRHEVPTPLAHPWAIDRGRGR